MSRVFIGVASGALFAVLVAILVPNPAVAIECSKNKSHNVFMGNKSYGDQLLYMNSFKQDGKLLRNVSGDLDSGSLQKRITYIELIDGYTNGKGGCAFLTNGGVGNYRAAFHLKSSSTGEGINFTMRVFGR